MRIFRLVLSRLPFVDRQRNGKQTPSFWLRLECGHQKKARRCDVATYERVACWDCRLEIQENGI